MLSALLRALNWIQMDHFNVAKFPSRKYKEWIRPYYRLMFNRFGMVWKFFLGEKNKGAMQKTMAPNPLQPLSFLISSVKLAASFGGPLEHRASALFGPHIWSHRFLLSNLPTTSKDIHKFWLEVKNEDLPNMKMIEHAGNKPRNSFLHVANWQFDDLVKISPDSSWISHPT